MHTTRPLSFVATISRSAPKYRRPRPGTAERPPYRAGDPLVGNPKAKVTKLVEGAPELGQPELTFIHRPPPSAPSPFSLTTSPASPLLVPKNDSTTTRLPPLIRPIKSVHSEQTASGAGAASSMPPRMSDADLEKLQELRRSDPFKYSRAKLAEMFNCTPAFVGMVAPLTKSQCKSTHKVLGEKHERSRDKWSEKHSIVMAIRKKRKELW
ncbi:mitochondrial ribosomal protein subunit L20-domain-containing protein [Crepidotus variabilis]|uniref:Mitochondrial ribosomal protein subunit L20-domain-containing protein n=1 Tax=Crepidotus variabilis TaxID=179855 RepID=A0A9P6EEN7_9AGAR|nr:mitochondrial ribosomal protein subunit L20-domain-containing protein [Crepidotus variabilis]